MSSYYSSPPSSPLSGFFPTGPASPHAFASFQQSPRDSQSMYAALTSSSAHNAAQGQAIARSRASQTGSLKKVFGNITSTLFRLYHTTQTTPNRTAPHM
ncbi:hypothetical protein C8Q78DRAFT_1076766 [Trametes maxima]|nr:hypothetical protein C8Q78DRAFT_1076766 [Trametes maxima]